MAGIFKKQDPINTDNNNAPKKLTKLQNGAVGIGSLTGIIALLVFIVSLKDLSKDELAYSASGLLEFLMLDVLAVTWIYQKFSLAIAENEHNQTPNTEQKLNIAKIGFIAALTIGLITAIFLEVLKELDENDFGKTHVYLLSASLTLSMAVTFLTLIGIKLSDCCLIKNTGERQKLLTSTPA